MRSYIQNHLKNSGLIVVVAIALCAVGGGSAVAAGHLIKGSDVQNNSLTGLDIKNRSIGKYDLSDAARATLQGPTGATGPVGNHGPMLNASSTISSSSSSTGWESVFTGQDIEVPATATKLLITFSAECTIIDPANYRSQYVSIRVDGVQVSTQATFCSNTSDYNHAMWASNSMQRSIEVSPGVHTISVYHSVSNAAATGYLDDKTLSAITGA